MLLRLQIMIIEFVLDEFGLRYNEALNGYNILTKINIKLIFQ